jgi:signal transduction histidine kinase
VLALVAVSHLRSFGGPALLALLLASASIAIRRRAPLPALVIVTVATSLALALRLSPVAEVLVAVPMYQVASVYDRSKSLPALLLAGGAFIAASFVHVGPQLGPLAHQPGAATSALVAATAAWFVGDSVRVRRVYVAGLAEQAAQRQREVLERAQRSVAEERLQIARELHDVVAHSLSVIAVQSGVGRHVIETQPEEAKKALAAIEATSRDTLTELRRMLGVLRRDDGVPATLAPAPGIAALNNLVEQVRMAGYTVNVDASAVAVRALPPTVELSIYRIAQEALTNVVKHAGPATVDIEIRDEPTALVLEVNDNGYGADAGTKQAGGGDHEAHHGIVGMRERVAMFHGSLSAAPRPEGGFRVVATFPVESLSA